jgi:hypothetical protein
MFRRSLCCLSTYLTALVATIMRIQTLYTATAGIAETWEFNMGNVGNKLAHLVDAFILAELLDACSVVPRVRPVECSNWSSLVMWPGSAPESRGRDLRNTMPQHPKS